MIQMNALCYRQTGPARQVLNLEALPRPAPAKGEVLVQIAVSGANPSDAKARSGLRGGPGYDLVIPHSDGAGRITAVGDGVDPARIGQRVWLWNAAYGRALGTAAEFVALPQEQAVPLPDAASFAAGACLGIPALTAHRCLFADGPIAGQDILITGGAGAVGAYGVQMAKLAGARRVVASTSGGVKSDHAWAMGADSVVNYRNGDTARAILDATDGRGVDRIVEVEFGGNLDVTRAVLKPNGVIAAYGSMADPEPALPFYPMMFSAQTLRMVLVYLLPEAARAQGIADLTAWLAEGALQHPVSLLAPLDEGWRAHEACEDNARIGAALIEVAKDV
tara:strand:+ start:103 stop:1107 length:1005 start_codon:yes stop_codon:yes gene_type:complete